MRDKVRDKFSKKQYDDEVSWTTRTWSSLMAQRMSVALHMAAAWEIATELSLAGAEDEAALFGGGVADSVASIRISYLARVRLFFCESSLLRNKNHSAHKGACSTQRQREEPRPGVTEGGGGVLGRVMRWRLLRRVVAGTIYMS